MDSNQMKAQLAQWLGQELSLENRLDEDLKLDSLDVIELTMNIEEAYHVMLTPPELMACGTVGGLIQEIIKQHGP